MPRWIDASPAQRRAITLRDLSRRDFEKELSSIKAEAEAVKARDDGYYTRESQRERALERLRCDWRSIRHSQRLYHTLLDMKG